MKIVIIIINYNTWHAVIRMLNSANSLHVHPEIIILDNNSKSLPPDNIKSVYSGSLKIIFFDRNYGYFGALGRFLKKYKKNNFEWLFIANPDLVFNDNCLFDYLHDIDPYSDIGVYCPSVISMETGVDQNPFMESCPGKIFFYKRKVITFNILFSKVYYILYKIKAIARKNKRVVGVDTSVRSIFAPHGAFIGFSNAYFDKGGIIETRNFLYYEEVIVGLICKSIGLRVIYDPRVSVEHEEHVVTGYGMSRQKVATQRNSLKVLKQYIFKPGFKS